MLLKNTTRLLWLHALYKKRACVNEVSENVGADGEHSFAYLYQVESDVGG